LRAGRSEQRHARRAFARDARGRRRPSLGPPPRCLGAEEAQGATESSEADRLYSLVASCEANGKNPVAYLTDVLLRIGRPRQKVDDLLPDRWKPS
jgi:hypothetical protein